MEKKGVGYYSGIAGIVGVPLLVFIEWERIVLRSRDAYKFIEYIIEKASDSILYVLQSLNDVPLWIYFIILASDIAMFNLILWYERRSFRNAYVSYKDVQYYVKRFTFLSSKQVVCVPIEKEDTRIKIRTKYLKFDSTGRLTHALKLKEEVDLWRAKHEALR